MIRILKYILCLVSFVFTHNVYANDEKVTFKIAYAEAWAPISIGSADTVKGILPVLMEIIISQRMGLTIEHHGLPWARAQQAVKTGEVDAFITTPTQERLSFSNPSQGIVFPLRFQPIVRIGSEEEQLFKSENDISTVLFNKKYCDVLGNGWAKQFYKIKKIEYQVVPTLDICLKHLAEGQTDIIIHAVPVAQSFIDKLELDKKVKLLPYIMSSSPQFPLLLSKKSPFGTLFIEEFDAALLKLKKEGLWENLITAPGSPTN